MADQKALLFIDAYDSFSQNIVALLKQELAVNFQSICIDTNVEEDFGKTLAQFAAQFSGIVIGPGPGNPNKADDVGILYEVFDVAAQLDIPVLGICLGFQALCIKYGLCVERLKEPCHGQSKQILYRRDHPTFEDNDDEDDNKDIFADMDLDGIWATCYNSLGVAQRTVCSTPCPSRPGSSGTNTSFSTTNSDVSRYHSTVFRLLAVDIEGNAMSVKHRSLPFWGFQFHPESCKSNEQCRQLVRNWWQNAQKHGTSSTRLSDSQSINAATESGGRVFDIHPSLPKQQHRTQCPASASSIITSELLKTSATSGNTVQWKSVKSDCDREMLSDLIHDITGTGSVAMLESTKKGRFSIYAITTGEAFQMDDKLEPRSVAAWSARYHRSTFSIKPYDSSTSLDIVANRDEVWEGLENLLTYKRAAGGHAEIPFWGGFIGYVSYEHGLDFLQVSSQDKGGRSIPDLDLMWIDRSVVYDNLTNTIYVQSIRHKDMAFIDYMTRLLSKPSTSWSRSPQHSAHQLSILRNALDAAEFRLPDHGQYDQNFHHCQSELRAGNSYELCLTTEATITIPKQIIRNNYEFELYKNLHAHNPVPFGAFIRLPGITVLGTSPEQYMSWSRTGVIDMIPMKGTVKRSAEMTFEKASEILSSPKESAENLMIADLVRHDLYNTVGPSSKVEVIKLCEVIEHETVYQLVSHIRAHAPISPHLHRDDAQKLAIHYGFKALRQTTPPGSMTGAPKKRSCEILSHLEQRNRGVYSGILGFMDVGGGGSWNVCIRTAFRSDDEGQSRDRSDKDTDNDVWHLGAGGAITVLSDAQGEWDEMMVKLNSVLQGFKTVRDPIRA